MKQWCDVEDQDGHWKIGYIIDRQSTNQDTIYKVRFDGYHPGYDTFYCHHSNKLCPVRTYTMGFNTYPKSQQFVVLRQPFNVDELKLNHNRLTLISRMQNLIENTQENIKVFMRTQLLILIDKILKTPFKLISHTARSDLLITNFFLSILGFYNKLLDNSKKFIPLIQNDHKMARELLLAMYEFSIMSKHIIGCHKNTKSFYEDPTNITLKADGFVQFLIRTDNPIFPFKTFFKNITSISMQKLDKKIVEAVFQVLDFFLDFCEKSKGQLYQSKLGSQTKLVIQQIINFLKVFAAFDPQNVKFIKLKVETINRLETIQLKLKPNKNSLLRNEIFEEKKQKKEKQSKQQEQKIEAKKQSTNQEIKQLNKRVKKLEDMLSNFNPTFQNIEENKNESQVIKPVKNLGEEQFLASLSWALNCGDLQVCKKLVTWRQNLLRLGKISGWEIALQVGLKTMSKAEISHQDIISANVQMIRNATKKPKQNIVISPLSNIRDDNIKSGTEINKPEKE